MTNSFFVYGTLKRGLRNEPVWPHPPTGIQPAWASGTLFDRPEYPAMKAGTDRVLGELWRFDAIHLTDTLAAVDRLEGTNDNSPGDLYHRVVVPVFDANGCVQDKLLGEAYTYHYVRDPMEFGFHRIKPNANNFATWPTT